MPKRRGRSRKTDLREVVNALIYALRTLPARMLPHDPPPWQTVYTYFRTWKSDGTLKRVHDALRAEVRRANVRNPEPGAAVIDSRSAQTIKEENEDGAAAERRKRGRVGRIWLRR